MKRILSLAILVSILLCSFCSPLSAKTAEKREEEEKKEKYVLVAVWDEKTLGAKLTTKKISNVSSFEHITKRLTKI